MSIAGQLEEYILKGLAYNPSRQRLYLQLQDGAIHKLKMTAGELDTLINSLIFPIYEHERVVKLLNQAFTNLDIPF